MILSVDGDTGVIEIGFKPDDPDTMLVATYERRRDDYDTNDPARKWGEGSALWRSTDGGVTFERITGEGRTNGRPTVMLGRMGPDWSVSEPNVVMAVIETELSSGALLSTVAVAVSLALSPSPSGALFPRGGLDFSAADDAQPGDDGLVDWGAALTPGQSRVSAAPSTLTRPSSARSRTVRARRRARAVGSVREPD